MPAVSNLHLDGHTIQGLSVGVGIVVLVSTAILIQGPGTITGFQDGLEFADVDFSKVIQVTATRNSADGFVVIGTPSTNNVFQGNVATLNRRGISMCSTAHRTATTTDGWAIGSSRRTNRAFSRCQVWGVQRLIQARCTLLSPKRQALREKATSFRMPGYTAEPPVIG